MQDVLFQQGLDLMLFGMGSVFFFLIVLVLTTLLMSFVIQRLLPETSVSDILPDPAIKDDDLLRAILQAAIDQHCSRNTDRHR